MHPRAKLPITKQNQGFSVSHLYVHFLILNKYADSTWMHTKY